MLQPGRAEPAASRRWFAQPGRALRWAAAAVLAFGIGSSVLAWGTYQGQVERTTTNAELRARGAAADVDRYVESRWLTLRGLATAPAVRTGDPELMREHFASIDQALFGFDAGISWIDRQGWMRARTGGYDGPPIDFTDRPHILRALSTQEPVVSSGLVGAVNAAPIVGFVVPVTSDTGTFTGLLGSGIRLGDLSIGADRLRYAGGTEVIVIDAAGQVIAAAEPVNELMDVDPRFPLEEMLARGQGVMRVDVGPLGESDQLVGFATAPTADWLVLVERHAAQAFGAANATLTTTLALIAGSTGLGIVLLLWAAWRLDRAFREQEEAYEAERSTRVLLQEAVGKLESREALREAFVGVMSHELRTPVTTIYGAAKLLSRSPGRSEARSLLHDIEEEAERLRRITEDLLVLSRAEHGLMDFRPEPLLLQRIVPALVDEIQRRHPESDIRTELPTGLHPVAADAGALRQVLDNLLTNAVKYGEGAPVTVVAMAQGDRLRLRVEDAGPGLPADELGRVFDLFFRSARTALRAPGTGIGLYVARGLAEAMRGSLTAYRIEPHGLGFELVLPRYGMEAEADLGMTSEGKKPAPAAVQALPVALAGGDATTS
jgi:signal transduction histidine kinase